jgi:hypothetical protein
MVVVVMLNVIMLNVANDAFMLSIIMLTLFVPNVVMVIVVVLFVSKSERYTFLVIHSRVGSRLSSPYG